MTTIKGYVGGILDGIADTEEKKKKYLLAVQTRTKDLENLVDQLSSYNKMENHTFNYRKEQAGNFSCSCFWCGIRTSFFHGNGSLTTSGEWRPWETCQPSRYM